MSKKPTWDQGKHFARKTAQWLWCKICRFSPLKM